MRFETYNNIYLFKIETLNFLINLKLLIDYYSQKTFLFTNFFIILELLPAAKKHIILPLIFS